MVRIQTTGKQSVITIPKEIMERLGWKPKDDLYIWQEEGKDVVSMIKNE